MTIWPYEGRNPQPLTEAELEAQIAAKFPPYRAPHTQPQGGNVQALHHGAEYAAAVARQWQASVDSRRPWSAYTEAEHLGLVARRTDAEGVCDTEPGALFCAEEIKPVPFGPRYRLIVTLIAVASAACVLSIGWAYFH